MNLQEYINTIYNGDSKWFVEEVSRQWHNERIMNILNIKQYLNGKHPILDRPDETYNGRTFKTRKIILQYAKVLLNFETSFLLKNPVTLSCDDTDSLQAFKDIYKTGKYNDVDFKLLDKMVKYGEIYEYTYIDNASIKSKIINPEDSYPVFNETGEMIAFIEYYTVDGISYYTVYEPDIVSKYNDAGNNLKLAGTYKNLSGLPIQYKTINEEDDCKGRSSLEDYVSILDNMEEILSKYGDSFFKFLNPIPVVSGTKLAIGKDGEGSINPNVVGYTLQLEDGSTFDLTQAKMDFQSLKALWDILLTSLLNISHTPAIALNATEISNVSETSIRMMYALASVKARINEMSLRDGFEQREDIIKRLLALQDKQIEGNIEFTFEYDIPQNAGEIIKDITTLRKDNLISIETALSRSPYIYDVQSEMGKLQSEKDSN